MSSALFSSLFSALLPALLDAALKGTVILAVAFALGAALRRSSAAARHLLWALTVVALLALPVLALLLPRWQLPLAAPWAGCPPCDAVDVAHEFPEGPGEHAPQPVAAVGSGRLAKPVLVATRNNTLPPALRTADPPANSPAAPGALPAPAEGVVGAWAVTVWAVGAGLALAWIGAGFVSLWRLRRHCRAVPAGFAVDLLTELAADLGIRRRVRLLESDRRAIPMTWGLLRPVVGDPPPAMEAP